MLCGTIPLLTYWFAGGRLKAALTGEPPAVPDALLWDNGVRVASALWKRWRSGLLTPLILSPAVMAFGLLVLMLVMQRRPRFSQFTSTVFALFYCGYLPSFWLKLRMLATPVGAPTPTTLATLFLLSPSTAPRAHRPDAPRPSCA